MSAGPISPRRPPFDRVVDDHGATVLRVCRALVGPVDADDAWSETFLAALRAYPGLDFPADLRAWLVTIAHRKSIDILRRRQRHAVPMAEVPETSPHHDRDGLDEFGSAWDALTELTGRQRQVVVYHHIAGMPYREIAEIVGGSEAAARRAGADGIAALRRLLGERPDTGGTAP